MILAVGAIFLLTVYGVRRLRGEKCGRSVPTAVPERDPDDFRLQARHALNAEFRDSTGEPAPPPAGGAVECPCCGEVYPAGTLFCQCGTETVEVEDDGAEEDNPAAGDTTTSSTNAASSPPTREVREQELVVVHIAGSHWKASLLKGVLEANDIPCVTGGNVPSTVYQFPNMPLGEVRLYVREQDAEAARSVLDECC